MKKLLLVVCITSISLSFTMLEKRRGDDTNNERKMINYKIENSENIKKSFENSPVNIETFQIYKTKSEEKPQNQFCCKMIMGATLVFFHLCNRSRGPYI